MSKQNNALIRFNPFKIKSLKPNKNGKYRIPRKLKKSIKRHRSLFLLTDSQKIIFAGAGLVSFAVHAFLERKKQNA